MTDSLPSDHVGDETSVEAATSTEQEEVKLLRQIDDKLGKLLTAQQSIAGGLFGLAAEATDIQSTLAAFYAAWVAANTPPPAFATTAVLNVQGGQMGLTVDSTGQNLILAFEDDHGDVTGPPPGDGSGPLVVTFSSDTPTVATVGAAVQGTDSAGNVNYTAPLTFGVDGVFNASATVANTSTAPLMDADGTTPFKQPAAVAVTVAAGQASTAVVSEG